MRLSDKSQGRCCCLISLALLIFAAAAGKAADPLINSAKSAKSTPHGNPAQTPKMLKAAAQKHLDKLNIEIAKDKSDWSKYYDRAEALRALGRVEEARDDLDKALSLSPKQVNVLFLYALLDDDLIEEEDGIKRCNLALTMPMSISLQSGFLILRSHFYECQAKIDLALKDLYAGLKLCPESDNALLERSLGRLNRHLNNQKEAIAHLTNAIKLEPKMRKTHEERADAYLIIKNYKAAISDYTEEMKTVNPPGPPLLFKRAAAYKLDGQLQAAEKDERLAKKYNGELFQNAPFKSK